MLNTKPDMVCFVLFGKVYCMKFSDLSKTNSLSFSAFWLIVAIKSFMNFMSKRVLRKLMKEDTVTQ